MKHPFRWIALAVGIAVAAFAVVLAVNVSTDPRADFNTSRLLGKPAPAFTLTDLSGKRITLADLAGKTVIVNFWNSWCPPCREELPALQRWYDADKGETDVVLLGIPRDDTASAIRASARDDGVTWTVASDRGAAAATLDYATKGQPETFAISPDGVVIASVIGPARVRDLDRMASYGRRGEAGGSALTSGRRLAWVGLAVVAVVVLAVALWPRGGTPTVAQRTRSLASELRCPDCEGISVADSATTSARLIRQDIAARLRRGQSPDAIRQYYVDQNGETILLKPSSSGIGVIVWALPVIVLLVGAGGLALALRRWGRQPRLVATDADEAFVAQHRATATAGTDDTEADGA